MSGISLWALFLKSARMTLLSCAVMLVAVPVFAENQRIQAVDGLDVLSLRRLSCFKN